MEGIQTFRRKCLDFFDYAGVGVIIILIIILFGFGIYLLKTTGSATATIANADCTMVNNNYVCALTLNYVLPHGVLVNPQPILHTNSKTQYKTGQTINIEYDVGNPTSVTHRSVPTRRIAWIIIAFTIIILAILLLNFINLTKRKLVSEKIFKTSEGIEPLPQ